MADDPTTPRPRSTPKEWGDLAKDMAHETAWPVETYRRACSLAEAKGWTPRRMREIFRDTMQIDPEGIVLAMREATAPDA